MPWKSEDARTKFIQSLPLELGKGAFQINGAPVCALGHVLWPFVKPHEGGWFDAARREFGLMDGEIGVITSANDRTRAARRREAVIEACFSIPVQEAE